MFSDDDLEREKLQEFCTASGQVSPHCACVLIRMLKALSIPYSQLTWMSVYMWVCSFQSTLKLREIVGYCLFGACRKVPKGS